MAFRAWRFLSLCAGAGGLDLGIRLAEPAARCVCYIEREAAAAANLVARMEDGWLHPAPVWSDLRTFDAHAWRGSVDCVVSGDPCQPNSDAGSAWLTERGPDDDRWMLDRVIEIVDATRPDRVFRENVTGNADGQLYALIPALERLGYRVAAGIFSASEVGAPHDRERLFIMADASGFRSQGSALALHHQAASGGVDAWGSPAGTSGTCDRHGSAWEHEPRLGRVAHGVADRMDRLWRCGNGVVPLVAGYAWATLEARLASADTAPPVVTGGMAT